MAGIKAKLAAGEPSLDTLMQKFKTFDMDGSGFITHAELRRAMQDLGYQLTNKELEVSGWMEATGGWVTITALTLVLLCVVRWCVWPCGGAAQTLMNRFKQSGGGISYQDFANRLIAMMFADMKSTQAQAMHTYGGRTSFTRTGTSGNLGVDRAEDALLKFVGTLMDRGNMPPRAALLRAFTELDDNGNNRIDGAELERWFASWDVTMSPDDVRVRALIFDFLICLCVFSLSDTHAHAHAHAHTHPRTCACARRPCPYPPLVLLAPFVLLLMLTKHKQTLAPVCLCVPVCACILRPAVQSPNQTKPKP